MGSRLARPLQVLSATCAAEEGTEALLSYASQGNAAFLTMYGFVPERNPFAAMELFGDVREAAAWAVSAFPPPVCPTIWDNTSLSSTLDVYGPMLGGSAEQHRGFARVLTGLASRACQRTARSALRGWMPR